jgi:uncharacterized protein YraI
MKQLWLGLGAALAVVAIPAAASAYTAQVLGDVNLRACASTQCAAILVLPRGAYVDVRGYTGGWDYVSYAGYAGYAASNYVTPTGGYVQPPIVVRPPIVRPYPVYPYPYYYGRPGFSLNFNFGDDHRRHR